MWPFKKEENGPGLDVKWKKGEYFPWKGLLFEVTKVEHAKLTLEPVAMTATMRKDLVKIKKAKGKWS